MIRNSHSQALTWLLDYYFLPTLSQSSLLIVDNIIEPPPLEPLLKEYKIIAKYLEKDSSLARQLAPQIAQKLKAVESWIVNVKANRWHALNGDPQSSEIVALEYLSATLVGLGGLVPISNKYAPISPYSQNSDSATKRKHPLSVEMPIRGFWQPFLHYIQTLHPSFSSVLVRVLIDELTLGEDKDAENNPQQGRFFCLAGWLLWVSITWAQLPECDPTAIVEQLLLRIRQPK